MTVAELIEGLMASKSDENVKEETKHFDDTEMNKNLTNMRN